MTNEPRPETATIDIRKRRPDELALQLEISNDASPPDWQNTMEEMEAWEALQQPDDKVLQLLALVDGAAVGAARAHHSVGSVPGRFEMDVAVRPAFRRRGVGRLLYRRIEQYALENNATELEAGTRETLLPLSQKWLKEEGYVEASRMRESELDISPFDSAELLADAQKRAAAAGITLTTLAAEDTPENRKKLWQVSVITERDIPFDTVHPDEPYERFEAILHSPLCLHDNLVIAKSGEDYVGLSITARKSTDRVFTWTTGVHPDFRGRGAARALKVFAAANARAQGFKAMRTFNHVNNPAMLSVNVAMGYRPLPEVVIFVKKISTGSESSS